MEGQRGKAAWLYRVFKDNACSAPLGDSRQRRAERRELGAPERLAFRMAGKRPRSARGAGRVRVAASGAAIGAASAASATATPSTAVQDSAPSVADAPADDRQPATPTPAPAAPAPAPGYVATSARALRLQQRQGRRPAAPAPAVQDAVAAGGGGGGRAAPVRGRAAGRGGGGRGSSGLEPWHTWVADHADGPAHLFDGPGCAHARVCTDKLATHHRLALLAQSANFDHRNARGEAGPEYAEVGDILTQTTAWAAGGWDGAGGEAEPAAIAPVDEVAGGGAGGGVSGGVEALGSSSADVPAQVVAGDSASGALAGDPTIEALAGEPAIEGLAGDSATEGLAGDPAASILSEACAWVRASQSLAETQLLRQASSLSTNLRRADSLLAQDVIVERHHSALSLVIQPSTLRQPLSVDLLLRAHRLLLGDGERGSGCFRRPRQEARCGAVQFAPGVDVPTAVDAYVAAMNRLVHRREVSHVGLAAAAHEGLVAIHPFHDGNGRMARILANWGLAKRGVPFVVALCSSQTQRSAYIAAVRGSRGFTAAGQPADVAVGSAPRIAAASAPGIAAASAPGIAAASAPGIAAASSPGIAAALAPEGPLGAAAVWGEAVSTAVAAVGAAAVREDVSHACGVVPVSADNDAVGDSAGAEARGTGGGCFGVGGGGDRGFGMEDGFGMGDSDGGGRGIRSLGGRAPRPPPARTLARFTSLLADGVRRVWLDLDRLVAERQQSRAAAEGEAIVRAARQRAAAEACIICLEGPCNVQALCCGAPSHLHCMARWLAEASQPSCCHCRAPMPRPAPRPSTRREVPALAGFGGDGTLAQLEGAMYGAMVDAGIPPMLAHHHVNARVNAERMVQAGMPRHLAEAQSAAALARQSALAVQVALDDSTTEYEWDTTTSSGPPSPAEDEITVPEEESSTTDYYTTTEPEAPPPSAQGDESETTTTGYAEEDQQPPEVEWETTTIDYAEDQQPGLEGDTTTYDLETTRGDPAPADPDDADTTADVDETTTAEDTTTVVLEDPAASESDTTTTDADTAVDTTTFESQPEESDSTTVDQEPGESDAETTTDDTPAPRVDVRGRPMCAFCNCQPALHCSNAACGRCCLSLGSQGCERHGG